MKNKRNILPDYLKTLLKSAFEMQGKISIYWIKKQVWDHLAAIILEEWNKYVKSSSLFLKY